MRVCSVEGCDRPHHAKGFCTMHHKRFWRYGDPNYKKKRKGKWEGIVCSVDGCDNPVRNKGMCNRHYLLARRGVTNPQKMMTKEKLSQHELHHIWKSMKDRCRNPNNKAYKNYGGRGIKVCDRWLGAEGFKHFLEDMGERPVGKLPSGRPIYTLDRIDVNGDYEPDNCRWATIEDQAINKRPRSDSQGVHKVSYHTKGYGPYTYWRAYITRNGVHKSKTFKTKQEALNQRRQWEK